MEKHNSYENLVWQEVFSFTTQVFTFSGSRKIFAKILPLPFSKYFFEQQISCVEVEAICYRLLHRLPLYKARRMQIRSLTQSFLAPSHML